MMHRDEQHLLPFFVHFYGTRFGYGNIHVFDNGSSPDLHDVLARVEALGVSVDRSFDTAEDYERKGEIIEQAMNARRSKYDITLPLDCDEFIGLILPDGRYSCETADLLDFFATLSPGAYSTGQRLRNDPRDLSRFYLWQGMHKIFFVKSRSRGLDVGSHDCTAPRRTTPTPLCYFELHNKPFDILRAHALNKMELRLDPEDRAALDQYGGPGMHLLPILRMSSEVEYLGHLDDQPWFRTDALSDAFERMEMGNPFA